MSKIISYGTMKEKKRRIHMNEQTKYELMKRREILKSYSVLDAGWEESDESQAIEQPDLFLEKGRRKIVLPPYEETPLCNLSFTELLKARQSTRSYEDKDMTLEQLSYLLWATQGVQKVVGRKKKAGFRTVPSAGCRHALETYLVINRVLGLVPGLYHYLPMTHELELLNDNCEKKQILDAVEGQKFAAEAPVLFFWTAVPYRMEWRYVQKAVKYVLLDAGHLCENLYLTCEMLGCGACAIGAYNQEAADELLQLSPGPSGEKQYECSVYAAAVGIKKISSLE